MNGSSRWLLATLSHVTSPSEWYGLWRGWAIEGKRHPPQHWLLHARALLNREELEAWHWLVDTFDDHHVMIKMPVTRFTRPNASENGRYWYELLKNVNCTFSVCADDGHVIGCVDVPKSSGLSHKVREVKENLLTQCGICYIVVSPSRLPKSVEIRNEFMGETAAKTRHLKREEAVLEAARISLRTTLQQQRRMRKSRAVHEGRESAVVNLPNHWHDSFLIQANSRPAELR